VGKDDDEIQELELTYVVYVGGWGPKIPGIVTKIYLKYLYKFEILVPFEVLAGGP
jgi:hypothetical protein